MLSTVSITSSLIVSFSLSSTKAIKHLGFAAAKIPKLQERKKRKKVGKHLKLLDRNLRLLKSGLKG